MEQLGRIDEALRAREEAAALEPEDQENLYYYALDLCDAGRFAEASRRRKYSTRRWMTTRIFCGYTGRRCHIYPSPGSDKNMGQAGRTGRRYRLLLYNRATSLDAIGSRKKAQKLIKKQLKWSAQVAVTICLRHHAGKETAKKSGITRIPEPCDVGMMKCPESDIADY